MSRCLGRLCGLAFGVFIALRAGQSPDWLEDMLPFARTKPAIPMAAVEAFGEPFDLGRAMRASLYRASAALSMLMPRP